ncbi:hypothetical protein [Wuhan heteroptera virus 1]|uniref:hypothetical protein n=1 Tax=Wuhan heteroptera virus 1 TaxID=1923701 RepID=UPI00090AE61B|nr:hypothetical protein [Wuhan heteroptera virus 1]APG77537.1 hypothetical protein [Wuhan heteroptera virus 1]APG77789.1 hypothetical protein [Wuhan heteroptera virus 1]
MSLTDFTEIIQNFVTLYPEVEVSGVALLYKPRSELIYSVSFSNIPPFTFNICYFDQLLRFFRAYNFFPFRIKDLRLVRFRQNEIEQHRWQLQFVRRTTFISHILQ